MASDGGLIQIPYVPLAHLSSEIGGLTNSEATNYLGSGPITIPSNGPTGAIETDPQVEANYAATHPQAHTMESHSDVNNVTPTVDSIWVFSQSYNQWQTRATSDVLVSVLPSIPGGVC